MIIKPLLFINNFADKLLMALNDYTYDVSICYEELVISKIFLWVCEVRIQRGKKLFTGCVLLYRCCILMCYRIMNIF
jgi:hypothetical protein